jgi:asparagine synthase (glutamine-hydrolysing)
MLDRIAYRGRAGREIVEADRATLGLVWTEAQGDSAAVLRNKHALRDEAGEGHLAEARVVEDQVVLTRDQIGVAPLYYGQTPDGTLAFASEVKALLEVTQHIRQLPAGHTYRDGQMRPYFQLEVQEPVQDSPEAVAAELRRRIEKSVAKRIGGPGQVGSWLSGGLDSSTMAALARKHVDTLHTFAIGFEGAPDLKHAREVAEFIGSDHHEVVVTTEDLLRALPDVIYHLESFDALLLRSSLTNNLVAEEASHYVSAVFSGEGGDELFAGYAYLKGLDPAALPVELIDITNRLQNTALQRVDRSASAHGTVAHVGFLDPDVVDYALRIPPSLKLRDGTEKWILRACMEGELPKSVLTRTKSKFWEGAGVGEHLLSHAKGQISDAEFEQERRLPNGWELNSKEELLYYRIFRERFGDLDDLTWMGRTKGAPKQ